MNMTRVSALGNWLGGEYHSQAFGGHTQCPPFRGPESWLAEGVMASPGSAPLKLTPSGLWTEPLCSCLTKTSKEPLEGEGNGSTSAPNVLVLSTPGGSGDTGVGSWFKGCLKHFLNPAGRVKKILFSKSPPQTPPRKEHRGQPSSPGLGLRTTTGSCSGPVRWWRDLNKP